MKAMPSLSWQRIIWEIVLGIALLAIAAFVSYYVIVTLPAQQRAAEENAMNAFDAQVRARLCPGASTSTNEALRRLCGPQPQSR